MQALCFSNDGKYLASGSFNGTVMHFTVDSWKKKELLLTSSSTPIYDVSILNNGKTVVRNPVCTYARARTHTHNTTQRAREKEANTKTQRQMMRRVY